MIATTEIISDNHTKLILDFSDEGVNFIGETEVAGDEGKSLAYAPFFEADLRRNNAELFPVLEIEIPEMGGEMI